MEVNGAKIILLLFRKRVLSCQEFLIYVTLSGLFKENLMGEGKLNMYLQNMCRKNFKLYQKIRQIFKDFRKKR